MRKGAYNHLDRDTPVKISDGGQVVVLVDMDTLVGSVAESNYGVHRFLSKLSDYLRDNDKQDLGDAIENLLNTSR